MKALVVVVAVAGCTRTYDGDYLAEVTTTVVIGAPVTATTIEDVVFTMGDMARNELVLTRDWPGDPLCELTLIKHGGYGLRFDADQTCAHAGATWTLVAGDAPNDRTDELVIDLAWTVDAAGTATETLRIAL